MQLYDHKESRSCITQGFSEINFTLKQLPQPCSFPPPFSLLASKYLFTLPVNDQNSTTLRKKDDQLSKQISGQFIQSSHSHMIIRCCHTNNFIPTIPPQLTLSSFPCSTPDLHSCSSVFWLCQEGQKSMRQTSWLHSIQYNPSEGSINPYQYCIENMHVPCFVSCTQDQAAGTKKQQWTGHVPGQDQMQPLKFLRQHTKAGTSRHGGEGRNIFHKKSDLHQMSLLPAGPWVIDPQYQASD